MDPPCTARQNRRRAAILAAASVCLLACPLLWAGQLPLAHFTTEQGLAADRVHCAIEDRLGYLWFGTSAGLSRFDGRTFRTFGQGEGQDRLHVNSIVEDGEGLLVGTKTGAVYRFDPAEGGTFTPILPALETAIEATLLRDTRGAIWVGRDGLHKLEGSGSGRRPAPVGGVPPGIRDVVFSLAADSAGNLWVGSRGLHVLSPAGLWSEVGLPGGFGLIVSVVVEASGRVWAGAVEGICTVDPVRGQDPPGAAGCRLLSMPERSDPRGLRLLARPEGGVWAGNDRVLQRIDTAGREPRRIGTAQGLPTAGATPLVHDSAGNPWFATAAHGVARLAAGGFTAFRSQDGLAEPRIATIFRTRSGSLVAGGADHVLHRLEGDRFVAVAHVAGSLSRPGWGWHQYEIQDRQGDWWIPTGQGIFRFRAVSRIEELPGAAPRAVYTTRDGLPSDDVFRLFEDRHGDIWVSTLYPHPAIGSGQGPTLSRWVRQTGAFQMYGAKQGVTETTAPTAFIELADGSLWIGFSEQGDVYRHREGRFERLAPPGRFAGALVASFYTDRDGRLWIATRGAGVCRVDDPLAAAPACARLTMRDGLGSDEVNGVAQDEQGRIYLGTSHGVDVLEDDRPVRHLGTAHGLPHPYVNVVFDDPGGSIWFGTLNGVARLDPASPGVSYRRAPPSVRIDRLRVAGVPRTLSALGETGIDGLTLNPAERRLEVDFIGLGLEAGEPISFQHRLDPDEPWSEPAPESTILLPHMRQGDYRLEVRAVSVAGVSPRPAVVSFRVLAPVWMRPWFLGLAAAAIAGTAWIGYRLRLTHLLSLERQRMSIAMDLHDEMGSGLGSIGVLADLAADAAVDAPRRRELLEQVATTASELGSSMGDIVRSLRSGSQTVEALGRHLSERGRRLFPEQGPALLVRFPAVWPEVRLSPAARHGLAMIGLEALHNAARHSGASEVTLRLMPEEGWWKLSISDNGRGIDSGQPSPDGGGEDGLGLTSMRRRAREIGADLSMQSRQGEGTTVSILFDPRHPGRRPVI